MVVASTDFTHYESAVRARENDMEAIRAIRELDSERLFEAVSERNISMCGYGAVATAISACVKLGAKKAELVEYANSGDVSGDFNQVVGYAGLIIA
jgi:MEMO1 family protein